MILQSVDTKTGALSILRM